MMAYTFHLLLALAALVHGYVDGPLSDHFQQWLQKNDYGNFQFARNEFGSEGSYGGKADSTQKIHNIPVVFVHGNADGALSNRTRYGTGWTSSIEAFLASGYSTAELYATTWGSRRAIDAYGNSNTCATLLYLRNFIEAVLKYTKVPKINIIAHSMGVTLCRRAIRGGAVSASDGICNLGLPLNQLVNTFVAIAGANHGVCTCRGLVPLEMPFCNKKDGFWPGDYCGLNFDCASKYESCKPTQMSYSSLLSDMNKDGFKEAKNVVTMWTLNDEIIGDGNLVFGRPTSRLALADEERIYSNLSHMEVKDDTAQDQVAICLNSSF